MLILGPKNTPINLIYLILGKLKNFPQKKSSITFKCLLNPNFLQKKKKKQKKVMSQS